MAGPDRVELTLVEICPRCEGMTPYVWDRDPPGCPGWELDGEWWHDPELGIRFADSFNCLQVLRRLALMEKSLNHRGCPFGLHEPEQPHHYTCWAEFS